MANHKSKVLALRRGKKSIKEIAEHLGITTAQVHHALYYDQQRKSRKKKKVIRKKVAPRTMLIQPEELDNQSRYTIVVVQGANPARALLKAASELLS